MFFKCRKGEGGFTALAPKTARNLFAVLAAALFSTPVFATSTGTRHVSYTYDSAGRVLTETVEPGASDPSQTTETDYTYDGFGNVTNVTVKGCVWTSASVCTATTRTSSTAYDTKGQFATSDTNAASQTESWTHDAGTGQPTSHTGPNGLTTSWAYDGFGRKTQETRPDGNKTKWIYAAWTSSSWPEIRSYVAEIPYAANGTTQNGPAVEWHYDGLNREVLTLAQHFNGTQFYGVYKQYDALGRVLKISRPYIDTGGMEPAGAAKFTTYTYDLLGRVIQASFPDASSTSYAYHGLQTLAVNDKGQTTSTVINAQGLAAIVTDAAGHSTYYAYDAFGDLAAVTDPNNNITLNNYDARGRKTASTDPDMGAWAYKFDSFGELGVQTDAKSQTTTLAYDALGRATARFEPGLESHWTYDTATNGVGQLATACTGSGCTSTANASYFRSHSYDTYGRLSGVTLTIGGTDYSYAATYNADGRLATLSYPSGFTVQYVYTATLGYLSQIKDNSTGTALWTVNSRDGEMHALSTTAGNGVITQQVFDANTGLLQQIQAGTSGSPTSLGTWSYAFDTIGNLTSRSDTFEGLTEAFCYDNLNRLTNYAPAASCTGTGTKTVGYDSLGNITSKTDVGTYAYTGSRPHAVSGVTGSVNGAANPSYSYDANGNMTDGAGRSITYTAFNMADTVTMGTTSDSFAYDSEHNRITSTLTGVGTTTYLSALGGTSEKLVSGSDTTWHDYIVGDGQIVAEKFSGAVSQVSYFVSDHLGSVHLIADATGTVTERLSYDAWGKRRNPDGTDATGCTAIASETTRGYTSQEHIDPVCAINYNARLYDPTIGRFMSADDIVPDGADGQDYNRYSYVNNGPLSAIDPTGHQRDDNSRENSTCPSGGGQGCENHPQDPPPESVEVDHDPYPQANLLSDLPQLTLSSSVLQDVPSLLGDIADPTPPKPKPRPPVRLTPPTLRDPKLPKLPDDTNGRNLKCMLAAAKTAGQLMQIGGAGAVALGGTIAALSARSGPGPIAAAGVSIGGEIAGGGLEVAGLGGLVELGAQAGLSHQSGNWSGFGHLVIADFAGHLASAASVAYSEGTLKPLDKAIEQGVSSAIDSGEDACQ